MPRPYLATAAQRAAALASRVVRSGMGGTLAIAQAMMNAVGFDAIQNNL